MLIARFVDEQGETCFGVPNGEHEANLIIGNIYGIYEVTDRVVKIQKLLSPIDPVAILGIGLNYSAHARESGMQPPERPVLFVKGINTLQHPGRPILLPVHQPSEEVDYECELAVVIGKTCKNVSRENALDYVLGYTCANDVSARDWQLRMGGGQWCKGKFFDTFAPLGPYLATPDEIPNPNNLRIRTLLNGEVVQDSNTSDMIFDISTIIEFLSGSTTLLPGTVILTGTPEGVGMSAQPPRWLRPGDEVVIDIENIGQLSNPVALES